jgi:hypothetical protein
MRPPTGGGRGRSIGNHVAAPRGERSGRGFELAASPVGCRCRASTAGGRRPASRLSSSTDSGGTDSETTYYGNATARSSGFFTIGTPDANGIATLEGSGGDTSGTGKLQGLRATYTYKGTLNTKTLAFQLVLTGTG